MKKILSITTMIAIILSLFVFPIKVQGATLTSQAGVVTLSSGRLNVRKSASTNSTILTSLSNGSYITLISLSGNWYYVEYEDGKYGYCHKDYIKTNSGKTATANTASTSLNVRSGPGTGYSIKDSVSKGKIVIILSSSNGWSKILYDGAETGYVSSQYLKINQSTDTYSAVSLSVPDFKQTDSRWANVIIGNSGKTIGKIGCATTGVAMLESYRTGKTIFPDTMSKKLSYSLTGNLYWPSDYTVVTSNSDYLNKIYQKLKEGKPILLGAKNYSGTQHWVVITGFTGGESLSASKFTINDPGTKYRTNLQQFLNEYSIFYKYFYY